MIIGSILGLLSGLHIFGLAIGALLGYFADELIYTKKILKLGTAFIEHPAAGMLDERWTRIIASAALSCGVAVASLQEKKIGLGEQKLIEDRILRELQIGGRETGLVRQLIERIFIADRIDPSKLAAIYKASSGEPERLFLLRLLLHIAAGGETERVSTEQNDIIKQVSVDLGIAANLYNNLRQDWITVDSEAYDIIGLSPQASDQEIHSVYRKLASQFHPDTGTDLDDSQREQANEAFLRIQDAYNRIITDRNALRANGDDGAG